LGAKTVLRRSIDAFAAHPDVDRVIAVIRDGDLDLYHESLGGADYGPVLLPPVVGGATRQLSVKAGLEALAPLSPDTVLIHDAARPFISAACISDTLNALRSHDGAIAAAPVTDTLKRGEGGRITATVPRSELWRAQTPQTFHFGKILAAHRAAAEADRADFTDDASIAEWSGLNIALVENMSGNMKITTAEDLHLANLIAAGGPASPPLVDVRSGTGYDVHAFEEGDFVTLCGVKIPHTQRLKGHSDADAPLHALTDALLGTIGAGDIGDHFPPSDPQWRGVASAIFLKHASGLVKERGGRITNLDIMIIAERPKIGPHREAMRAYVAELLELDIERVSVKATTNEKMGFIGRGEGLAAMATATVVFGSRN
jgi:2-C-methyl-D-erythritol 4-phosphate cytidylyltransferase/2-C-methyl-D-erythritol 2,4-cyclodiphosphate synthase